MRDTGQTREAASTEIEAVELNLLGRVRCRHRHDQSPQRRRLARLRATDNRDIACAAGQVEQEQVATLVIRAVDDADGSDEIAWCGSPVHVPTGKCIDCRRLVERRQPDTVRRGSVSGNPPDKCLQQRRNPDSDDVGTDVAVVTGIARRASVDRVHACSARVDGRRLLVEQRQRGIEYRTLLRH
ncbi:Uncharacterised protein [Mycobacteroides abscessus subsp. abscessus]|nr:Uncharacterised protein [Mycobacteroides abscessus subsp. abscessus]